MKAQNIILGGIVAILIIMTIMAAKGKETNITVPAPEVQVTVEPADVITELTCPECPTCPDFTVAGYVQRYETSEVRTIVQNHIYYNIDVWLTETITPTYKDKGKWEIKVKFRSNINLVRYFYFDEITGRVQ